MSFQNLVLNNIEVMGYNHQNNFFGEKSFHYSTTKTLSIRGYVLDLTNSIGVRDIFIDTTTIKNVSQNFYNIIINNFNYGVGKIISLSFDEGNWVRSTQFSADIEILERANLQELVSKDFFGSNYLVQPTGVGGLNPLSGYEFYLTTLKNFNAPVYFDTTNQYALWRAAANSWRITTISNIGIGGAPRFQRTLVSSYPPTGGTGLPYVGAGTFTSSGSLNLFYNENYRINLLSDRLDLIKSFSENFDIDFDNNNKILGGTHSIDIEYTADNKDLNVISLAQNLASELLTKAIPAAFIEGNYNIRQEGTYKVLRNESYDVINGKCGFKKSFSYGTNNNLKPYSVNRTLNIELGEDGVASVQENCDIKAENDNPSLYSNALIGLNEQISGAYLRCSGLYRDYSNSLNLSGVLNPTLLQRSTNINKFDGTINYNVNFNNDKKNSTNYIFEFTSTLDRNESFIWNISERGSVQGVGNKNSNIQYSNAETGWGIVKTGITSRSSGFWNQYAKEKASTGFNLISKKISRSPYKGEITYDYSYTDDPTIRNDLGDIKRLTIEYSDSSNFASGLLPIYKEFIIPNNIYTLVHNRNLKQQGDLSISLNADVAFTGQNQVFNGFSYFNILAGIEYNLRTGLFFNTPATDRYLESASFTSDEIEQSLTYKTNIKYS